MHYSESLQHCVYLLNKYRWMAGDTTTPEIECKKEKERKVTPSRPLSPEERKTILELYAQNLSYLEITKRTGRAYAVIRRAIAKAGIQPKLKYQHLQQDVVNQIVDLYHQGMRPLHIAEKLGIPSTTVHSKLKRMGLRLSDGSASASAAEKKPC